MMALIFRSLRELESVKEEGATALRAGGLADAFAAGRGVGKRGGEAGVWDRLVLGGLVVDCHCAFSHKSLTVNGRALRAVVVGTVAILADGGGGW